MALDTDFRRILNRWAQGGPQQAQGAFSTSSALGPYAQAMEGYQQNPIPFDVPRERFTTDLSNQFTTDIPSPFTTDPGNQFATSGFSTDRPTRRRRFQV